MKKIVFICYAVFLVVLVVFSFLFVDKNFPFVFSLSNIFQINRFMLAISYFILVLVFFLFFSIFINKFYSKKWNVKEFKILIGLTVSILIFSYPAILSYDIFNYVLSAKVLYFYHENPYLVMPNEFIGDSDLLFTRATNKTILYGPTWIIFSAVPYIFGSGSYLFTLFLFKVVVALFYLGTLLVIYNLKKDIRTLALFGLNPLVLIETLVSGHNDIVMMFFAIVSLLLLIKRGYLFSFASLATSVLVKFATMFLLPVHLWVAYRIWRKKLLSIEDIAVVSSLAMAIIFLLSPFREEIYPWYAIWFLVFSCFLVKKKMLQIIIGIFCLGLLFRYIPYMASGSYGGLTPILRETVTVVPVMLVVIWLILRKWSRLWAKIDGQL